MIIEIDTCRAVAAGRVRAPTDSRRKEKWSSLLDRVRDTVAPNCALMIGRGRGRHVAFFFFPTTRATATPFVLLSNPAGRQKKARQVE